MRRYCARTPGMPAQTNQRIDGKRLWDTLMGFAEIGATPKGGVRRLTLTERRQAAATASAPNARRSGLTVRVDAIGNMFARRAGPRSEPAAGAVRQPSRQPALRRQIRRRARRARRPRGDAQLNDLGITTEAPVELVNWTDEEGSRFGHSSMGSGVWAGVFSLDKAYALTDTDGVTVRDRARPDRLPRPGTGAPLPGRCLFRAAYRAGPDPGARGQADRHRHRRPGAGVVRRGRRPGRTVMPAPRRRRRARTRWCARRGSSTWSTG